MGDKDQRFARILASILTLLMIMLAVPALAFAWDQHQCQMKVSSAATTDAVASASGGVTTAAHDSAVKSTECLSTRGFAIWVNHRVGRQ